MSFLIRAFGSPGRLLGLWHGERAWMSSYLSSFFSLDELSGSGSP